jgi:phage/plasmid-like protein (TIGR03299 family)
MSHEFESGVFANNPAWHGLGTVFNEQAEGRALQSKEALVLGGLDWEVELDPVYDRNGNETDFALVVRDSDESVLGCVGPKYYPIQNTEAFSMLDGLIDADELAIETAVSLQDGKRVCVVARRPDNVLIAGEDVTPYIVCMLYHDGTGAAKFLTTPTRVVCMNTFRLALWTAQSMYSVRHTASAPVRLQEAREALQISYAFTDEFAVMGGELVQAKFSDREFDKFLKELVEDPEDKEKERAKKNAEIQRLAIKDVYDNRDNLNNIRGTRWGALNAVVEYNQHVKLASREAERRFMSVVDKHTTDQRAFDLLTADLQLAN